MSILIILIGKSESDCLSYTPLVEEIANLWPGATIDILATDRHSSAIFNNFGNVKSQFIWKARKCMSRADYFAQWVKLWSTPYCLTINLHRYKAIGKFIISFLNSNHILTVSDTLNPIENMPVDKAHLPVISVRLYAKQHNMKFKIRPFPHRKLLLSNKEIEFASIPSDDGTGWRKPVICFSLSNPASRSSTSWWQFFTEHIENQIPRARIIEVVPSDSKLSSLQNKYPCYYSSGLRMTAAVLSNCNLLITDDIKPVYAANAVKTLALAIVDNHNYTYDLTDKKAFFFTKDELLDNDVVALLNILLSENFLSK